MTHTRTFRNALPMLGVIFFSLFLSGCSIKRKAINMVADTLTTGSSSLGSDDDPELVGDSLPFALITLESLADSAPDHVGLRTTLASGFTQYAYAYVDLKAELSKYEASFEQYETLQNRARKLYMRGQRWGMDGLKIGRKDFDTKLAGNPTEAVKDFKKDDVPLLYWTGAAWLAAISISTDRADMIAQLPQAVALLERALQLDPDWGEGSIHEVFIPLDMSRDEGAGGGEKRALEHYQKALELSKGRRASVHVSHATSIAVKKQDRAMFNQSIEKALAINPDEFPENRLSNLLSQQKARYLQAHVEDLFDSPVEGEEEAAPAK